MGWTDAIDAANELLPRRWKRKLGVVVLVAFLVFPNQGRDVLMWYGQERAREFLEILQPVIAPKPPATVTPGLGHEAPRASETVRLAVY